MKESYEKAGRYNKIEDRQPQEWVQARDHMQEQGSVWLNGDTYYTVLGFQHEHSRDSLQFINADGYWQNIDKDTVFQARLWYECNPVPPFTVTLGEPPTEEGSPDFNFTISIPGITQDTKTGILLLLHKERAYHEGIMRQLKDKFDSYMIHKENYDRYSKQIEEVTALGVAVP